MSTSRLTAFCLAAAALLLSACGKAPEEKPKIVNYTLPDVSSFNESYAAEQQASQSEAQEESSEVYRWVPHGVFTLNVVGDDGDWAAGFVNISLVDLEKSTAVLTYSIKDSRGFNLAKLEGKSPAEKDYFFDSGGELVTGVDEIEDEGGFRRIVIYLPDNHWLEFSGKEKITSAQYHFNGNHYGMKREG